MTAKWEITKYGTFTIYNLEGTEAIIQKFKDTKLTKNPFKVIIKGEAGAAFYPKKTGVKLVPGEKEGGYFTLYYGDLKDAKEYAEKAVKKG